MEDTDDLILEVFAQFMEDDADVQDEENMSIDMKHLPAVFNALGIEDYYMGPSSDPLALQEIKGSLDPGKEGRIAFSAFNELMPFFVKQAQSNDVNENDETEEIHPSTREDFLLFTEGEDRPIEMRDLQRVSRELKDEAPVELLQNMLQLHKRGGQNLGNRITMEDFDYIMKMTRSI